VIGMMLVSAAGPDSGAGDFVTGVVLSNLYASKSERRRRRKERQLVALCNMAGGAAAGAAVPQHV
jgi:hypothetical protein